LFVNFDTQGADKGIFMLHPSELPHPLFVVTDSNETLLPYRWVPEVKAGD
jgi:hypothetical protein